MRKNPINGLVIMKDLKYKKKENGRMVRFMMPEVEKPTHLKYI